MPKILISLRNPINVVYSLYNEKIKGYDSDFIGLTFEEILCKDAQNYSFKMAKQGIRKTSLYYHSVKNYISTFSKANVEILIFEEWKKDTLHALEDICDFLEIERYPFKKTNVIHNPSGIPKDNFSVNLFKKLVLTQNTCKTLYKRIVPAYMRKDIRDFARKHLLDNNLQKIPMKEETRKYLKEYYREDIAKLEELLGRDLSIWYNEK